ncbi:MAG: tRNA (adenine(22)-N(1))-methyltransferase [Nannocystaceae bacterium]|nr:class I SAM-dependent methyltransferase [bacterium]
MSPTLSPRLRAVADLVIPEEAAADIGCDHAQLAAWWVASGTVPRAIASDVRPGPLAQARRSLDAAGLTGVEIRQGSGLATLRPAEVSTIAIAGMGGHLIVEILRAHPEIVGTARRVILQPNTAWEHVRRWLSDRHAVLDAESLTDDAGHTYLTVAFRPTARGGPWSEADIVLGPRLRRERPPALAAWVARRREHLETLAVRLASELGPGHPRVDEVKRELHRLDAAAA